MLQYYTNTPKANKTEPRWAPFAIDVSQVHPPAREGLDVVDEADSGYKSDGDEVVFVRK